MNTVIQNRKRVLNTGVVDIYADVDVAYSVRKLFSGWTKAVMKVRRGGDNQTRYVFFNGVDLLDAVIGTDSSTPSATTFSSWYGSGAVYVEEWISQNPSNTIDSNKTLVQSSAGASQPSLVSLGNINLKNGKPFLDFNGTSAEMESAGNISSFAGDSNSIFTVSHNDSSGNAGYFFSSSDVSVDGYTMQSSRDSSVSRIGFFIPTTGATAIAVTPSVANNSNQLAQVILADATTLKGYLNGVVTATAVKQGSSLASNMVIGRRWDSNFLNGGIQELISFPSNKTSGVGALNANINNYFSIY